MEDQSNRCWFIHFYNGIYLCRQINSLYVSIFKGWTHCKGQIASFLFCTHTLSITLSCIPLTNKWLLNLPLFSCVKFQLRDGCIPLSALNLTCHTFEWYLCDFVNKLSPSIAASWKLTVGSIPEVPAFFYTKSSLAMIFTFDLADETGVFLQRIFFFKRCSCVQGWHRRCRTNITQPHIPYRQSRDLLLDMEYYIIWPLN